MATDELHCPEPAELTRRVHAGELTSAEATEASLARVAVLDGMLHGAPLAVKGLCWMQGVPTAAVTVAHRGCRPAGNATVVDRSAAAGGIILGKLQLTEGACADHRPPLAKMAAPGEDASPDGGTAELRLRSTRAAARP